MATIRSITIKNFKGIGELKIQLSGNGVPPVHTLIGLNESGKTTILEGLSHFITGDNALSSLFDGVHTKSAIDSLIPVTRKAAFTGEISISAVISLDEDDYEAVAVVAKQHGLDVDRESLVGDIEVRRIYKFADSAHEETTNLWVMTLLARQSAKGKAKAKSYKRFSRPTGGTPDIWMEAAKIIQKRLPRIAYFPTFLVDMPKKVYLTEHQGETPVNRYYRLVLQDILDSMKEGLSLDKHVVARINSFKEDNTSSNWFSALFGGPSRSPIDSVFTKVSNSVTREVLGSWQRVFQRKISAKNILIEWNIDAEKQDLPYATFSIFDGESRYYVSERSLGFRWFFSFLLFTGFKNKSKTSTLFLFDEPAANLHAKAQAELLKSFSRTVSDGSGIVYSTHSHHMINPHWITGAYIVENTALDYDSDQDPFGLNIAPTNIIATPYRHFVAQHPSRTSYFQPVTDMLEYVTPEIIGDPPFVLVEGITDFYALAIARKNGTRKYAFSVMPGVGAGAAGPQISLLLARGDRFIVLLDDDAAGRRAAEKYRNEWFLSDQRILTLGQLNDLLHGKKLETLLGQSTVDIVQKAAGLTSRPTKKQIALYLAEAYASEASSDALSKEANENLTCVLDGLQERFDGGQRF